MSLNTIDFVASPYFSVVYPAEVVQVDHALQPEVTSLLAGDDGEREVFIDDFDAVGPLDMALYFKNKGKFDGLFAVKVTDVKDSAFPPDHIASAAKL